jgi:hypothetical protein
VLLGYAFWCADWVDWVRFGVFSPLVGAFIGYGRVECWSVRGLRSALVRLFVVREACGALIMVRIQGFWGFGYRVLVLTELRFWLAVP